MSTIVLFKNPVFRDCTAENRDFFGTKIFEFSLTEIQKKNIVIYKSMLLFHFHLWIKLVAQKREKRCL